MPTPQRLPLVNSDDGTWGDILRQFLMKEHFNDDTNNAANGGHQTVTIKAGTATAGTAPLKFTSGTLLTTPEAGAVEFNTDTLYFTQTTSTTRKKIAAYDDTSGATGDIYYRDSSGYFVRLGIGGAGNVLTVSGGIPTWSSTIGNTSTITVKDANLTIQDDGDTTKQLKFELSGLTTGHTTTLAVPEINGTTTIVGTDITQTLTNKTINLSSNVLSGTTAQFNAALSDGDFATTAAWEQRVTGGANLVYDPQFNDSTLDHEFANSGGGGSVSYSTEQAHSGTQSYKVITSNLTSGQFDLFYLLSHNLGGGNGRTVASALKVQPGQRFYYEIYARQKATNTNSTGVVYLLFWLSDSTGVNSASFVLLSTNQSSVSNSAWQKLSGTLTIPAGYDLAWPSINFQGQTVANQSWYFDDARILDVSDPLVTLTDTQTLTNKTLTTPVLTGLPTGTGVASAATASTLAARDANANLTANAYIPGAASTATAAGTTTLTIADKQIQTFTGSTTQTVKLPTTSVVAGMSYTIINLSTGAVTVQASGGTTIATLASGEYGIYTALAAAPTTSAFWSQSGSHLEGVTIGASTAAPSITAATLKKTGITALSGSTQQPWLDGTLNYTGSLTGGGSFSQLSISDAVAGDTNYIWGLGLDMNVQSPSIGLRGGIKGHVMVTDAGSNTQAQAQYVGVYGRSEMLGNISGTSGTPIGSLWGGWFFGSVTNGSIHAQAVYGTEIDVYVNASSSVDYKYGLALGGVTGDGVRGTIDDIMITLGKQGPTATTWANGIMFGNNQGVGSGLAHLSWPFASDSTMIGTAVADGTLPANIGIDFSGVTFTDAAIKTGAAHIDLSEMASAPSATAGHGKIYVDSTGTLNYKGPTSTEGIKANGNPVLTTSNIGMLAPARVATTGSETYTVASGSVTQISGTTINGISPSVGDRILVKDAPSASGGGSANSSQPGNGVYAVTSNTTNLSLSRVVDMSGSIIPAGLGINVEAGTNAGNLFTVTTPSSNAAFTYGTGTIAWTKNSNDSATATLTNKTLTNPAINNIVDSGGRVITAFSSLASTANYNYIAIVNRDSGGTPFIGPDGFDTNIDMVLQPKGTGGVGVYVNSQTSLQLAVNGTQTNIDFNVAAKGSGVVKANGNPVISSVTGIPAVTGTPSSTTYLRGDGTWATPAGGGTSYTLQPARVATVGTETFTIASGSVTQITGTTVDGVSVAVNDRIVVKDAPAASGVGVANSNNPANGVYTVTSNTTNLSLSRTTDLSGSVVPSGYSIFIEAGSNATNTFVVSTPNSNGAFTYGTGNIQWTKHSSDSMLNTVYTANVGDGSSTDIVITHNLGTRAVNVSLYNASTFDEVDADVTRTSVNSITLHFATAPASAAYVVVVSNGTRSVSTGINSTDILDSTAFGRSVLTSSSITVKDANWTMQDDGDTTKQMKFQLSGITTGQTRTLTVPDATTTLVGTDTVQTLSNKTISSPTLSGTMTGGTAAPNQLAPAVTTSSASSLTLTSSFTSYVFTGSSDATWTLPAVSGNTGATLYLYNRGTANVTVQRAGTDNIMNQGTTITTIGLKPGASLTLINDGTYWLVSQLLTSPVYFDAVGTPAYVWSAASANDTFNGTHVSAGGVNNVLLAFVDAQTNGVSGASTVSATYNGTAMTLLQDYEYYVNGTNHGKLAVLYMFNPPSGSHTLAYNVSTPSSGTYFLTGNSVSYSNVGSLGTAVTSGGVTSTSASLSVNSFSGGLASMMFGNTSGSTNGIFSAYNQTSRFNNNTNSQGTFMMIGDGSLPNFTATLNASVQWAGLGVPLNP